MPWQIINVSGQYCVQKQDGETISCHNTEEEAQSHLAALYASEKAVWDTSYINSLPDSAFLFVESGEKDSEGKTTPRSLRHLPYKDAEGNIDLPHLRNAIARANQIKLKDGSTISESKADSLKAKAQSILERTKTYKSIFDRLYDFIFPEEETKAESDQEPDQISDQESKESTPMLETHFTVSKDASGTWRFDGIYSNTQLDRDQEILTDSAHTTFSALVNAGIVPYPVLLPWHLKDIIIGQTDSLSYDSATGLSHVSGYFFPEHSYVAESIFNNPDLSKSLGMSHGMPRHLIDRNPDDPSQIIRYVSTEVSVLPRIAAANLGTSFTTVKEEPMELRDDQKKFLAELGITEDYAERLQDLKSKEMLEKEESQEEPTAEAAEEQPAADQPTEESSENKDEALRDEVAEALTSLANMVGNLTTTVKALSDKVDALEQTEEAKIKAVVADTPRASLNELIMSTVIGKDAARVDGRSTLAKGPKEVEETTSRTGIPILDAMMSGKDWREAMEVKNG